MISQLCLLVFCTSVFAFDFTKIAKPNITNSEMTLKVSNPIVGLYIKDEGKTCYTSNSVSINDFSDKFNCSNNNLLDVQSSGEYIVEVSNGGSDRICMNIQGNYSILNSSGKCTYISSSEEYQFSAFVYISALNGALGQVHDYNHDHYFEYKQRIICISLWNKRKKGVIMKSANSNKHKFIRNWYFLNGLNGDYVRAEKM